MAGVGLGVLMAGSPLTLASVLDHSDVTTLWSILVPKKVNVIVWRSRRDFLPSKLQLSMKRVSMDSLACSPCRFQVEDRDHALFSCPYAQSV